MGILVILVLGFVGYLVYRQYAGGHQPPFGGPKESPLDVAEQRYARGEIDREEFERLKKDLS